VESRSKYPVLKAESQIGIVDKIPNNYYRNSLVPYQIIIQCMSIIRGFISACRAGSQSDIHPQSPLSIEHVGAPAENDGLQQYPGVQVRHPETHE